MKKINYLLIFASAIIISCNNSENKKEEMKKAIDLNNMDLSINPGNDFYYYANGNWLKNNPIPEEYSRWGAFNELIDLNEEKLKELLDDAQKKADTDNNEILKKIGYFYSTGMDTNNINSKKISELNSYFDKINNLKDKTEIIDIVSLLHTYQIYPFFYLYSGQDEKNSNNVIAQLYQGGLGLPDMSYYIENDERSISIRDDYQEYISKIFSLIGYPTDEARNISDKIFRLEKKLAEKSFTRLELRDPYKNYNKTKLKDIDKISPLNWSKYFQNIGISENIEINIGQAIFFKELPIIINQTDINDLKSYLKWNIVNSLASSLNKEIEEESFNFYGTSLSGKIKQLPRWKRVLNQTDENLGELLGQLYVEKYFPPKAKEKITELVTNIKSSFKERIKNLDWMTDSTKQKALAKLDKISLKLGYPDKWIDYSILSVNNSSYLENILNARKFNFNLSIAKINKPVDKAQWHMTPQTVNAYYSPNMNEIVFPAAILQAPFFDFQADDAVNYGGIGAVIAHELTHGFDDQGKQYDLNGNLSDWWTKADIDMFNKKTEILVNQFNNFKILDSLNVDGKLTLGENIADLGGVTISLNALKKTYSNNSQSIDDLTPTQRFFISYAILWRMNIREKELMRRLKEDVHSPGIARVNGIIYNVPEFYEAFNITENSTKYIKPENRAKIW